MLGEPLFQPIGRVGMHRRAVYNELAFDVLLHHCIRCGVYGCIVANAHEDNVSRLDSLADGINDLGFGSTELLRELFGTGLCAIVQDQGLVEVAFLDEVLAPGTRIGLVCVQIGELFSVVEAAARERMDERLGGSAALGHGDEFRTPEESRTASTYMPCAGQ
ncbi:hypothetical protein ACJBU6_06823 [Exserohilum turcicum]